jgi:hypothetical protein
MRFPQGVFAFGLQQHNLSLDAGAIQLQLAF